VLSPQGLSLTKLTHYVACIHSVPPFGADPYAWLEATLSIITSSKAKGEKFDVLICTQEQIAILSAEIDRAKEAGIKIAVPDFSSLRRVMDKISACETLRYIGLIQPESVVLSSLPDLSSASRYETLFPAFAKLPIATGSTGVRPVSTLSDLQSLCQEWLPFINGGKLLLQKAVPGPLLMICGVFFHGKLVAWHSCLRAREGVNGGASEKVSLPLPIVGEQLEKLGRELKWHGALSLDAILVKKNGDGEKELYIIDINPRIVEPMNGLLAGVDLVAALLGVSLADNEGEEGWWDEKVGSGREGVVTHQFVLALFGAAKKGRLALIMEIWGMVSGRGTYKGSVEELTPLEGDWWSGLVLVFLTGILLLGGRWMVEKLSGGTIKNYAISPKGWKEIVRRQDEKGERVGT
jgi:hypothetical protein